MCSEIIFVSARPHWPSTMYAAAVVVHLSPVALASGACDDSKLDQDNTNEKGKR